MNTGSSVGRKAERMVADVLRKNGAIISKMNYHSRYGEIDIVAETRKFIIFVEVKLRRKDSLVSPGQAVDSQKQRKIILTARDYLAKSQLGDTLKVRFDVAEVVYEVHDNSNVTYSLNYIKNAF